eukprot:TRINITY_DN6836_c0_g1_i1.p1 TRINITY_DN6836_c0_g1~~TRINITY_DN6836_c0_g1_i1.p1  ORF type:complete len:244 (-),score=59.40 TRINITY_DN6836_c0_g1_i1:5-736(-)
MENLVLDPKIVWVVLVPILFVMMLINMLRTNVARLMAKTPAPPEDKNEFRDSQALLRSQRLRTNFQRIPREAFEMRRHFFTHADDGVFSREDVRAPDPMAALGGNGGMMPGMEFQIIQILIFQWVNYFFSGFIVMKLPFALTTGFKAMFQRGINLPTLQASYVSSASCPMNMTALQGVTSLIFTDPPVDSPAVSNRAPTFGTSVMTDMKKLFESEREELGLINWFSEVSDAETQLLSSLKPSK